MQPLGPTHLDVPVHEVRNGEENFKMQCLWAIFHSKKERKDYKDKNQKSRPDYLSK
jgi:hypothetical protein